MINPADLLDAIISALQHVQEIVTEMDGDSSRITAYHDAYPTINSWVLAVQRAPSPSITGVWIESAPSAMGQMEVYEHRFSLAIRSRRVPEGSSASQVGYYKIFQYLVNGVPTNGNGLPLVNYQVHSDCHPMELPHMSRKTDEEGIDFFEVLLAFKELHA